MSAARDLKISIINYCSNYQTTIKCKKITLSISRSSNCLSEIQTFKSGLQHTDKKMFFFFSQDWPKINDWVSFSLLGQWPLFLLVISSYVTKLVLDINDQIMFWSKFYIFPVWVTGHKFSSRISFCLNKIPCPWVYPSVCEEICNSWKHCVLKYFTAVHNCIFLLHPSW